MIIFLLKEHRKHWFFFPLSCRFRDPRSHRSHQAQVGFQVCVRPGSYKVGPQTLGHSEPLDPRFSNSEIEWITKEHGGTLLYGLLVRVEWWEQGGRRSVNVKEHPHTFYWKLIQKIQPLPWAKDSNCPCKGLLTIQHYWHFSLICWFFVVGPRTPSTGEGYGGLKEEQTLPALYVSDTCGRFLKKEKVKRKKSYFSSTQCVCLSAAFLWGWGREHLLQHHHMRSGRPPTCTLTDWHWGGEKIRLKKSFQVNWKKIQKCDTKKSDCDFVKKVFKMEKKLEEPKKKKFTHTPLNVSVRSTSHYPHWTLVYNTASVPTWEKPESLTSPKNYPVLGIWVKSGSFKVSALRIIKIKRNCFTRSIK